MKRSVKLLGVPEKPLGMTLARKLFISPSSIPLPPSRPPTNVLKSPSDSAWAWTSGFRTTGITMGRPLYDPTEPAWNFADVGVVGPEGTFGRAIDTAGDVE